MASSGASVALGDFTIPADIVDYMKKARAEGYIPNMRVNYPTNQFANAKNVYNTLVSQGYCSPYAACAILGSFAIESGWGFKPGIVNTKERDGGGSKNTGGNSGCGEGWFGITYWSTKIKIINGLNVPSNVSRDAATYGPPNMLTDLPMEWQYKVFGYFLKNLSGKHGSNLSKQSYNSEDEKRACLFSSYLYKAAPSYSATWSGVTTAVERYKNTHRKYSNTITDGFAAAMYMSLILANYLKTGGYWKGADVDKLIGASGS